MKWARPVPSSGHPGPVQFAHLPKLLFVDTKKSLEFGDVGEHLCFSLALHAMKNLLGLVGLLVLLSLLAVHAAGTLPLQDAGGDLMDFKLVEIELIVSSSQ